MEYVNVESGRLHGLEKDGYTVFLSVPYATPPTGALRWAPPRPALPWQGVREAASFGPRAWQGAPPARPQPARDRSDCTEIDYQWEFHSSPEFPDAPEDEDCLVLNVWTPARSAEERLPVAVWIHGGAFANGSGQEMEFDGAEYARRGIVLVTVNYRLGLMGFFCHPGLMKEQGSCGNYGLMDQAAALDWVQRNIAAFGGDPGRVTLFGQSAGCISVELQCAMPGAENRFRQIILQSGGGYDTPFQRTVAAASHEEAARQGLAWGERHFQTQDIGCLRKLSPARLRQAVLEEQQAMRRAGKPVGLGSLPFLAPVVDGQTVPLSPGEQMAKGGIVRVPSIIGSNSEDLAADQMRQGSLNWARLMEQLGAPPAYAYEFTHKPLGDRVGAFHSCELWYMFGTLDRSWRPKNDADYALSREMLDRWAAFIKTGNPNGEGLPLWKPCTAAAPCLYRFA